MRGARVRPAEIQPAWSGDQKVGRSGRTRHPHARRQSSLPRHLHRYANGRTAAEGEGQPIKRRASCGRAHGALQALCGRRPSPSGSESRDGACARACWVDRSASQVSLRIPIAGGKNRALLDPKRANADSAGTGDLTKRRAEKTNAALTRRFKARAYAAPAPASQSWLLRKPIAPDARSPGAPNRGSSAFCAGDRCN
jgi:hypothetical protein